jgi:hypothetical protein
MAAGFAGTEPPKAAGFAGAEPPKAAGLPVFGEAEAGRRGGPFWGFVGGRGMRKSPEFKAPILIKTVYRKISKKSTV